MFSNLIGVNCGDRLQFLPYYMIIHLLKKLSWREVWYLLYSKSYIVIYWIIMSHHGIKNSQTIESFNSDLKSVFEEIEEGHYLFLIADRKKAFLFLFGKGNVEKAQGIMDPSVNKKVKSNSGELYGRTSKQEHKIDSQIKGHLKLIMQKAEEFIQDKHINGVFIGGHREFFHEIKDALPKNLQQKLRGEFVTELNISDEELVAHCKNALSEYLK